MKKERIIEIEKKGRLVIQGGRSLYAMYLDIAAATDTMRPMAQVFFDLLVGSTVMSSNNRELLVVAEVLWYERRITLVPVRKHGGNDWYRYNYGVVEIAVHANELYAWHGDKRKVLPINGTTHLSINDLLGMLNEQEAAELQHMPRQEQVYHALLLSSPVRQN